MRNGVFLINYDLLESSKSKRLFIKETKQNKEMMPD